MAFLPGLELSRRLYFEAVAPVVRVPHAAALIGPGSEVLGFDTEMSTDHGWGARLQVFVPNAALAEPLARSIAESLPAEVAGFPTAFGRNEDGSLAPNGSGETGIVVTTLSEFSLGYLGVDVTQPLATREWLTIPSQKFRSLTAGAVFHDEIGLEEVRARLRWYPHDVWRYLLASAWTRIGQEEHLMGRAGFVGDEIGSALIGARLVRDLMRLGFLVEREYAPYPKWFGTAFSRLSIAKELTPFLRAALRAESWPERESALGAAYRIVAEAQNRLGLCEERPTEPLPFFGRPFRVIELHAQFADALRAQIQDPELREGRPIGNIDLFTDSTDLTEDVGRREVLEGLW